MRGNMSECGSEDASHWLEVRESKLDEGQVFITPEVQLSLSGNEPPRGF